MTATTIPTAAAQVGNGRTPHRVRTDGFHAKALCNRTVSREFAPRALAKLGDFCKGCEKALAALTAEAAEQAPAVAEEAPVEEVAVPAAEQKTPARPPVAHCFDSTGEAYDATQCREEIHDGDVLVIETEKVVGFLVSAWPAAITVEHGELHRLTAPAREYEDGKYAASADLAEQIARELGADVDELHATPAPVDQEQPAQEPDRFCAEAGTCLAFPGHREDRITVSRVGHADAVQYVALPHVEARSARTVLAAFGWELVDGLEYIAASNLERGFVRRVEPADTPEAAELRAAVLRQTTARAIAIADNANARHFRAVMPADGGPYPIGWTHRILGYGENAQYGWVTAKGRGTDRVGVPTREDAERIVCDWHATGKDAPSDAALVDVFASLPADELGKVTASLRRDDEDMPAEPTRCVHGFTERPGDVTAPAAACASKESAVSVGVFSDEGCVDKADCAVEAAEIADRHNEEDEAAREAAADGEPLYRWAVLCADHEEQPAIGCEDCATDEDDDDDEPNGDGDQGPAVLAPFTEGDRVMCSDGLVRTATHTETSNGKDWVFTEDRSAWPVDSSERIDTSRIAETRAAAMDAATALHAASGAPDAATLAELGDALRYLRQADPDGHAAMIAEADRITVRVPRAEVAPGDILHDQGRHDVLDVCTVATDAEAPRWWALILGHTEEVRAFSGRKPWATALHLDLARTDEVTVERPLPGTRPAVPAPFTEGDRIVCADGVARAVRAMAPSIGDEPARVVVEDGTEWIADNCRRANHDDVEAVRAASTRAAARVRTNPNPADPEWNAALAELGTHIDYLKAADPLTQAALAESDATAAVLAVHADAHDFQPFAQRGGPATVGWTFRVGYGHGARYGIVGVDAKLSSLGLYEYRTTAVRAALYSDRGFTG